MASTTAPGTELMKKLSANEPMNRKEFGALVPTFKDEIARALPMHLKGNAEKYARQCISLFNQNPKLQACAPVTILSALMTASALGLDLTPQLGQCYIIPYDNRKKVGDSWKTVTEAQFQLGYRGAIALAQRSDRILRIAADVVREKDMFIYSKGLHPKLEHEESQEEDRGEITHVYAVANFSNGGYVFEVWPVARVVAHAKRFSKSYYKKDYKTREMVVNENGPWFTDFEAMARKTMIMAIWKFLPVSTEILHAVVHDETTKDDISSLKKESDIIDILPTREPESEVFEEVDETPMPVVEEPAA